MQSAFATLLQLKQCIGCSVAFELSQRKAVRFSEILVDLTDIHGVTSEKTRICIAIAVADQNLGKLNVCRRTVTVTV